MKTSPIDKIRAAFGRVVAPFKRDADRQMDDEMRFHIAMEARDLASSGIPTVEAERLARARFGGVERYKDEGRDTTGSKWFADFRQDVHYARRSLGRNRGYAVVSILTLALAIGASTTIFGVMNGVLLKPLPFPKSDKLFQVWDDLGWVGVPEAWVTGPEVGLLNSALRSFDGFAAVRGGTAALSTPFGEPEQLRVSPVSANFFTVLRRGPVLGRGFAANEEGPTAPHVIILSHALWHRKFASDTAVVGSKILIDGDPTTVIGVLPSDFEYALQSSLTAPSDVDAYVPIQAALRDAQKGNHFVGVVARVRDSVPAATALAELKSLSTKTDAADYKGKGFRFVPVPIRDRLVREVRPAIIALMAAVGLLVAIMCANLATLALARASRREREFAVRRALGAGHGRIARQVLTETTVISLVGAACGVTLAWWGIKGLLMLAPAGMPRRDEIGIDGVVVAFTLGLGLVVGLVMGLAPLAHSIRADISRVIGERSGTARGHRLRGGLVVAQVALSMMLLAGTGLLLASFARLMRVDGGFTPSHALSLTYTTPAGKYRGSQAAAYHQRVIDRIRSVPGVQLAAVTSAPPLSGNTDQSGAAFPESPTNNGDREHDQTLVDFMTAGPEYFRTMGISVIEGREFLASDDSGAAQVAIIDQSLARHFFPTGTAIGKRIRVDGDTTIVTVVGVVASVHMYDMQEAGRPQVYAPDAMIPYRGVSTVIRTTVDPATVLPEIRAAFHANDPVQPIARLEAMDDVVSQSLGQSRLVLIVVAAFALTALLLAAIGIYGVTSTTVAARSREVGIRVALGARPSEVFGLLVRRPMVLVALGILIGLVGTFMTGAVAAKLLYGVKPTDPATVVVATFALLVVAGASAMAPASRAAKAAAALALRSD